MPGLRQFGDRSRVLPDRQVKPTGPTLVVAGRRASCRIDAIVVFRFRALVDPYPQLRQAPEGGQRSPCERLVGEAKAGEALEHGGDSELRFESGQRRTET